MTQATSHSGQRSWAAWVVGLALGIAAIAVILSMVDLGEVWDSLAISTIRKR